MEINEGRCGPIRAAFVFVRCASVALSNRPSAGDTGYPIAELSTPFHNYGDVFSISSCRRKPASRCDEAWNQNWIPAFAGMT
jgi:hypothetical protein